MRKKSTNKSNLFQNFISLFILQASNYIFPLLTWPILSNYLGINHFGILMIILSICAFGNIITDFGFNLSATYKISQLRENKPLVCVLLSNIYTLKTILALIVGIGTLWFIHIKQDLNYQLDDTSIVLIMLIILFQSWQCPWFFQGIEKMKYIAMTSIIAKLLYLISIIILINIETNTNMALLSFLISQIFLSLSYIFYIYKEKYYFGKLNLQGMIEEFKTSIHFFISRIAVSTYTTGNVILLGYFHTPTVVGLYASAEKLYSAGTGVASVLSQAMYPYTSRTGNLTLLLKLVSAIFIPFCIGCYTLSFFSEDIMSLIFGADFYEGGKLLDYFLFLLCITFLSVSIGYPGFAAIQRLYLANYTVILGATFHIIGITFLYYKNEINPITILKLVIFTESLVLLLRIVFLLHYKNKE